MNMETLTLPSAISRYERYVPSGVRWFDEIPEHWSVGRVKRLLTANDAGIWGVLGDETDTMVLRSTEQAVDGKWSIKEPAYVRLSESERQFYRLVEGDLVVTKSSGSDKHIGKTSYVDDSIAKLNAAYSNFNQRLRSNPELFDPKLLYYVLNNSLGREQIVYHSSTTTGLANLNGGILGEINVPLPPLLEQTRIATFLDRKCAQIDQAIAQKQRQIALLKERRQVLVQQAVTKGLDPKVKMKDSGVAWLGEVPAHWELRKLKYVVKVLKRIAGELGHDVLSITQTGIKVKDIESGEGQIALDYTNYQRIYKGEFGMNHMDLITGYVDISKYDGVISPDYRVFKPTAADVYDIYLLFLFQMCYKNRIFYPYGQGVSQLGRWRFPAEAFHEFLIPVPPVAEQKAIQEHIVKHSEKGEQQIGLLEASIAKLKEYRSILINAAVTGQIKVPGA